MTAQDRAVLITQINTLFPDNNAAQISAEDLRNWAIDVVNSAVNIVDDAGLLTGGGGVADGDKGDIIVSGSGASWTIDNLAVSTGNLVDSAITEIKIGPAAVSTDKIADNAINADKLEDTGVSPGFYSAANITVDAQGRITSAENGASASIGDGNKGDITVSGSGDVWAINDNAVTAVQIAFNTIDSSRMTPTAVTSGSYTNADITVDAKGRLTAAADHLDTYIDSVAGTYIVTADDNLKTITLEDPVGVLVVVDNTLPVGSRVEFIQKGLGLVTFSAGAGVTIHSFGNSLDISGQYGGVVLRKSEDFTYFLTGDLA